MSIDNSSWLFKMYFLYAEEKLDSKFRLEIEWISKYFDYQRHLSEIRSKLYKYGIC